MNISVITKIERNLGRLFEHLFLYSSGESVSEVCRGALGTGGWQYMGNYE